MMRRHDPGGRLQASRSTGARTLEALSAALTARDERGVRDLLHTSVTLVLDGGGHGHTGSVPLTGRTSAASRLMSLMTPETTAVTASVNGVPGITLVRHSEVVAVVTADARAGRLTEVWVVCNPTKLRHWNR